MAQENAGYEAAKLVTRQFNLRREPTKAEIALADSWVNQMKLSQQDILAACAETVSARSPSFAYLDAILKRHSGGAGVEKDIQVERRKVDALKEIYAELGDMSAPAPEQIKRYGDFVSLGFEREALVEAARRCAREGMHDFSAWEKYVSQCAQKGLLTLEALRINTRRIDQLSELAESVMQAYGDDRRARNADREWIEKWLDTMPMDVILLAAQRSQGTQTPRKYLNKLLAGWQQQGIRTVDAAMQAQPPAQSGPTAVNTAANSAAQGYDQREYRDEDFAIDAIREMLMGGEDNDASGNN